MPFGEFESLAVALRRRWRMFQQVLRRLHLRRTISAWAYGGPAGVWQENKNSADVQRTGVNITGFISKVVR
jgi:hypothetical protein